MHSKSTQSRICSYFSWGCKHASTSLVCFSDLPLHLRISIYEKIGLPTKLRFDLTQYLEHGLGTDDDLAPYRTLRLTNRHINAEITAFFLSSNEFLIKYGRSTDLSSLLLLDYKVIRQLTNLIVHLNVSSCNNDRCCYISGALCVSGGHGCWSCKSRDEPLTQETARFRNILKQWREAVRLLCKHTDPKRFNLRLVCDVKNEVAADLILEPLHSLQAERCSIRLSEVHDETLQRKARTTSLRVTRQDGPKKHFRFMDLPLELRSHILTYTDLVTPVREVQWNSSKKFHLYYCLLSCAGIDCPETTHSGCRFRNCWERQEGTNTGCFCSRYHVAFPHCGCWEPPTSLFLVSRQFRQEAIATFYESNRFIIVPTIEEAGSNPSVSRDFGAAEFFTKAVPTQALCHLRQVEIAFHPPNWSDPPRHIDRSAYESWVRALTYVKQNASLHNLILSVRAHDRFMPNLTPDEVTYVSDLPPALKLVYEYVIYPLEQLQELKHLFVMAPWVWAQTALEWTHYWPSLRTQLLEMESELEKKIMGQHYDSLAAGKKKQRLSQWLVTPRY